MVFWSADSKRELRLRIKSCRQPIKRFIPSILGDRFSNDGHRSGGALGWRERGEGAIAGRLIVEIETQEGCRGDKFCVEEAHSLEFQRLEDGEGSDGSEAEAEVGERREGSICSVSGGTDEMYASHTCSSFSARISCMRFLNIVQ